MKTGLTKNYRFRTIPRVGQTDAGSAGEQPARDNRPGRRNHVGVEDSSTFLKLNRFWSPICLKKLPAEDRYYLFCVKGVCPFQAEPIQKHFLSKNSLCVDCLKEGRTVSATEVHHVLKAKDNRQDFYDSSQWLALCKSCHSKRTAQGE